MFFNLHYNVRLITNHGKQRIFKSVFAMHWTRQITLCHQPYHGEFTAKITGSPNIVYMVNQAIEDLQ